MDIKERDEILLISYLEEKCGLHPTGTIKWEVEDCIECGSSIYTPIINGFESGIRISDSELYEWFVDTNIKTNVGINDLKRKYFKSEEPKKESENVGVCIDSLTLKYRDIFVYDYVDLGLPSGTKWATCNLGASKPEEIGDYFMWGSITPNTNDKCVWKNTPFNNGSPNYDVEYFIEHRNEWVDNDGNLKSEYDAVYRATGGVAHIPTKEQVKELLDNTYNTTIGDYNNSGVRGVLFTSKSDSSKTIFIPNSGRRMSCVVYSKNEYATMWSSSLSSGVKDFAFALMYDGVANMECYPRYDGFCMRGVIG